VLNHRFHEEEYADHWIRIYAQRPGDDLPWTIQVDVQAFTGKRHEPITAGDSTFLILEVAFATGSELGRQLIDTILAQQREG
jgi:hypothetical protein